jgi:hypothetical protein
MKTTILVTSFFLMTFLSYSKDYSSIIGKKWKVNEIYVNENPLNDTSALNVCYLFDKNYKFQLSKGNISIDLTYTLDSSDGKFSLYQNSTTSLMDGSIQYFDNDNLVFFYKAFDKTNNLYHNVEIRMINTSK